MLKLWHQPIELEQLYMPPLIVDNKSVLIWETCRRKIYFLLDEVGFVADSRGYLEGLDAEAFLVEILCGIHSPVIGETEILGQFRQFLNVNANHEWVKRYYSRTQSWFNLVKEIREKYFYNFGSQSYGSYLRRILQNHSDVQIIGAGSLVDDVLPWLQCKNVQIYARNVERAEANFVKHSINFEKSGGKLSIYPLVNQLLETKNLIIAAPISHDQLQAIVSCPKNKWDMVIDLRRDAGLYTDRVNVNYTWITLDDVIAFFAQQKDLLLAKQKLAIEAIADWKLLQARKVVIRPFGWEDLCG